MGIVTWAKTLWQGKWESLKNFECIIHSFQTMYKSINYKSNIYLKSQNLLKFMKFLGCYASEHFSVHKTNFMPRNI